MRITLTVVAYVFTILIPVYFGLFSYRETEWVRNTFLHHFIVEPPAGFLLGIFIALVAAISHILLHTLPTPLSEAAKSVRPKLESEMFDVYTGMFSIFDLVMRHRNNSPSYYQSEIRCGILKDSLHPGLQNKVANNTFLYNENITNNLLVIGDTFCKQSTLINDHINTLFHFHTYLTSDEITLLDNIKKELNRYDLMELKGSHIINGQIFRVINPSLAFMEKNLSDLYDLFVRLQSMIIDNTYYNREIFIAKIQIYFDSSRFKECADEISKHGDDFPTDSELITSYKLLCDYNIDKIKTIPLIEKYIEHKPHLVYNRLFFRILKDDDTINNLLHNYYTADDLCHYNQVVEQEELDRKSFINDAIALEAYYKNKKP